MLDRSLALEQLEQRTLLSVSFQGLGFSYAHGLSADGSVVVGEDALSAEVTNEAVRWTEAEGTQRVGFSRANGASDDGAVVVGKHSAPGTLSEAFIWTNRGGPRSLGFLPGHNLSTAHDVSADGSIVVGESGWDRKAFWWSDRSGMNRLSALRGEIESAAYAVSADGSIIVGQSTSAGYVKQAVVWEARGGARSLKFLPGHSQSVAFDVSADGSVVVGQSYSIWRWEAFIWAEKTGMRGLGVLPGKRNSVANAVSADGSVVVGESWTGEFFGKVAEAFIWSQDVGMRSISDVLSDDYGIDLKGWNLAAASDISSDGRTIIGTGTNPEGLSEAWIARLGTAQTPTGATDPAARAPGDANGDSVFDQLDIVAVLQADKYLSHQQTTWEEGDWNGDGLFDQLDIVWVQQLGRYNPGTAVPPPFDIHPLSDAYLLFRERDTGIPGIDHVGLYLANEGRVWESQIISQERAGRYWDYLMGEWVLVKAEDGVQQQHTFGSFMWNSKLASDSDTRWDQSAMVSIDPAWASAIAARISDKVGSAYWDWLDGLLSMVPGPAVANVIQKGLFDGHYTCVGLIERAAEEAGYQNGEGFIPYQVELVNYLTPSLLYSYASALSSSW